MELFLKNVSESYDKVANQYKSFVNELDYKPLDRDLLVRFANMTMGQGKVCDLGCGPGHIGAFLHKHGVDVMGIDLSEKMIQEARLLFNGIEFEVGDMLDLSLTDGMLLGIVAFYSIVNLPQNKLKQAFCEMYRVLDMDGKLLISFHVGNEEMYTNRFLDQDVLLSFYFFEPESIIQLLEEVGFIINETVIRYPYKDVEYQSKRAYIMAIKN